MILKSTSMALTMSLCFLVSVASAQDDDRDKQDTTIPRGQLAIPVMKSAVTPNEGTHVKDAKLEAQAIDTLADYLSVDTGDILMVSMTAVDWPDSSMGCPKPGYQYLAVITPGHQATLKVGEKAYRVNMAKGQAEVCDKLRLIGTRKITPRPETETETETE